MTHFSSCCKYYACYISHQVQCKLLISWLPSGDSWLSNLIDWLIEIFCSFPLHKLLQRYWKSAVLWDRMLCSLAEVHQGFGGTYCLYLQDQRINQTSSMKGLVNFYQTTWHHIPSCSTLHSHSRENLEFKKVRSLRSPETYFNTKFLILRGCLLNAHPPSWKTLLSNLLQLLIQLNCKDT
jgi:hypothetical protein